MGVCARYKASLKESHLQAVKKIIKYVSGTTEYDVWYTQDTTTRLVRYRDADWARNLEDKKSTSRGCFFLWNNLMSCVSIKQNYISLSTVEDEYIVVKSGSTQPIWMKNMLKDYGVPE